MQRTSYDIDRLIGIHWPDLADSLESFAAVRDPLSEVAKSLRCGVAATPSARVWRPFVRDANGWNKLVLFCGGCRRRSARGRGGASQPAVPECLLVHGGTSHDVSPVAKCMLSLCSHTGGAHRWLGDGGHREVSTSANTNRNRHSGPSRDAKTVPSATATPLSFCGAFLRSSFLPPADCNPCLGGLGQREVAAVGILQGGLSGARSHGATVEPAGAR